MEKRSDIVVVGKGLAGLNAAIEAAKRNYTVTLISEGIGSISIGGGAIDLLGYDKDLKLINDNPLDHINELNSKHPYRLIGRENIADAIVSFQTSLNNAGLKLTDNKGKNKTVLTVFGTTKPSYLTSESSDASTIMSYKKILIPAIAGVKDLNAELIRKQLLSNPKINAVIDISQVDNPLGKSYRNISPLDIARYIESGEADLFLDSLFKNAASYDAVLIPPILGVENHTAIYEKITSKYKIKVIEMASIPPGVAGLRIYDKLIGIAAKLPITMIDNAKVTKAEISGNKCEALITSLTINKKESLCRYSADNFIIAGGGFLGGALTAEAHKITENIFGLKIKDASSVIGRSSSNIFGDHFFAQAGVDTNSKLRAIDNAGNEIFDNVYFAGKMLSSYDFPREKSGYGVAVSSAYHAVKTICESGSR